MAKATKKDIQMVMEDRIISLDDALSELTIGSEEHSRIIKDMSNLANSISEMRKATIQKEDNEAKREEQKRMNDAEIEFKQTQLSIDYARMETERLYKERQNRLGFVDCIRSSVQETLSWFGYAMLANRAYKAEYQISDGSSKQLPTNMNRALLGTMPKKKF